MIGPRPPLLHPDTVAYDACGPVHQERALQIECGVLLVRRCAGARRGLQLDSPAVLLHRGAHAPDRARGRSYRQSRP